MRVVQQPQRLCLQAMNDVLLAPQERMTMQTAVDGTTLLQQQAEWHLVDTAAPCHEDSCTPERTTCTLYLRTFCSDFNVPVTVWRITSTSRHWSQTTTKFCLSNVSGCSTYSSVHCQWQSVSCYSRSSVEQSSIARHCCPPLSPSSAVILNHISSHFLIPLSDSSLICTVPAQWLVILDTV